MTSLQLTHTQLPAEALALIGQALIPNTSMLQLAVGGAPASDLVQKGESAIDASQAVLAAKASAKAAASGCDGDDRAEAGKAAANEWWLKNLAMQRREQVPRLPVQALKGETNGDDGYDDVDVVTLADRGLEAHDAMVMAPLLAVNEGTKRVELMNNKLGRQGALQLGRALMANRMSEDETALDWVGLGGNDIGGEQDRRLRAICYGLGPQPIKEGADDDEDGARVLTLYLGETKQAGTMFIT
jgi:hypothetical protein